MWRNIILITLSGSLAACAGVAPNTLTVLNNGNSIHVAEAIVYEVDKGMFGTRYEFRVNPGIYRAAFADAGGTYYQGPPSCFRTKLLVAGGLQKSLVGKTLTGTDCGFYMDRDPSKTPSVYMIIGTGFDIMQGSSEASTATNTLVTNQIIENPQISTGGAGVAGGIAGGMVAAFITAEQGRLVITDQPAPAQLKSLVVRSPM